MGPIEEGQTAENRPWLLIPGHSLSHLRPFFFKLKKSIYLGMLGLHGGLWDPVL